MKKTLLFSILLCIAILIFLILIRVFPKNASLLPALLVLMILDGYLWFSIVSRIERLRPGVRYLLTGFYWLPLILLVSSIITGIFVPFLSWQVSLRTFIPGLILTTYICKVFPIVSLVCADLIRTFRFWGNSFTHGKGSAFGYFVRNRWILMTGWLLGGVFFILMMLGMFWWNFNYTVRKQTIVLPELPKSFDGLTIVQISDIHLGSWGCPSELDKAINLVNAQKPDLIFFTGDMANYSTRDVIPFESMLKHIKSRLGIFAILGNHDYGDYITWTSATEKLKDMDDLISFYHRLGWKLLMNEHYILKNDRDSIAILGIQNWGMTKRFQRLGDVEEAERGVKNMDIQLLLTHDPTSWKALVCNTYRNIDVCFSGHTHGFQFGFERWGIHWSPAQYLYDQWGGLYSEPVPGSHPLYLYVNRGLGSIGYPGRIGMPPEITLFTLRREEQK